MSTSAWLMPALAGVLTVGCAPTQDDVEVVAAAAEVMVEEGELYRLEELLCGWLGSQQACAELGQEILQSDGIVIGAYGPSLEEAGLETGVFRGGFFALDRPHRGGVAGHWQSVPETEGGWFEGESFGSAPHLMGSINGVYAPLTDSLGFVEGFWSLDHNSRIRSIDGVYLDNSDPDIGGGHFLAVWNDLQVEPEPTIHKLSIRHEIDGRSELVVGTYHAYYNHLDYAAPGLHHWFGQADPTSEPQRPSYLQGFEWYPTWPEDGENRDCGCSSSVFETQPPHEVLVPWADAEIELDVLEGRGEVEIVQYPDANNDYQLIIEFDDNPQGGPAWYEVELTFVTD